MLRGMRQASSNWLGRIVMAVILGAIAVSFAIWGIADIFRGFGRSTVARIGSTEITVEQFRRIYNDRLQQLGRELRRPITPDLARAFRLEEQLIQQLVAEASLDQRARQLGLNLSDEEVAREIMADPNFKSPGGAFDPYRFQLIIRNAGYTEAAFTNEQRRLTMRREVAESINGELNPPKAMADAYNRFDNEQRAIDYVVFDASKAGDIPTATPEELAKYYDAHKAQYRAPEYRSAVVLSVTPADIAKAADVSDDDARKFYEANKARFGQPEKRQVEQIAFPNADEAAAAAARIEKNEITFEALAKERGLTDKDIDLGLLTKAAMVDTAIADAAFALAEGATSAPVKGRFNTVLLHVSKIEPEQVKPFEEVSADIKKAIASDRAKADIATLHDSIEKERDTGLKLSEVAAKLKLQARTIDAIDPKGLDANGQTVAGVPAELVGNIYASDVGVENEPLQSGGGYIWFDVTGVKPARDRTLDEVKAKVEEDWRNEQIAQRLKTKATEMADKVKAGTSFADAAAAEGVAVRTTFGLKRSANAPGTSPQLVQAVFASAKGDVGQAVGASATEMIVFQLTDIAAPAANAESPDMKRIEDAMRRALAEDLLSQYVARLQTDYGATINMDALRSVSSPTDQ